MMDDNIRKTESLCCTEENWHNIVYQLYFIYLFICLLPFLGLLPAAYGISQARGQIGAVATSLH